MIDHPILAVAVALFAWWFFTGILLWRVRVADNGGPDQHLWSVILGMPMLGAGVWGADASVLDPSPQGIYVGFFSALLIWGWIELAFLSGVITGPNRQPCPPGVPLRERFMRSLGTVAWHELLLAGALVMLVAISHCAVNTFAMWTFAILFFARISAKLNLFFGVPYINTDLLPRPLRHLTSHFRRASATGVFPVSITLLSFASACWMERAVSAQTQAMTVGYSLLTALTLLALIEHWFMIVPFPDQKLWRWMLPTPKSPSTDRVHEDFNGL